MRSIILGILWTFVGVAPGFDARAADAWFGVPMPDEREQKSAAYRSAYATPDLEPLSLRLAPGDDPYAGIEGREVHEYLVDVVRITEEERPQKAKYWGRIAGTQAELAVAEYMADRFGEFGLEDVRTEDVNGNAQWWPVDWALTLVGDSGYGEGTADHRFTSAFPAPLLGTGAMSVDNLEAELIYVGRGHSLDLLHRDVAGKIALVRADMQPDPFFQTARGHIEDIVEAGAVAVVIYMDAPGNHQYVLERLGSPDAPCFLLGGDDGRFLAEVMAAAGESRALRMRVSMEAEVRPSWRSKNIAGLIPGETDEYVIVTAHLDGFFTAANDNASGLASLLALARHFAERSSGLRRNHLFVGTSAHHEFSDGAKAFVAAHPDIMEKTVLVMNIEHPSSIQSYYRGPLKLERVTVPGQLMVTTGQSKRALAVSNANPLLISIYKEGIDRYGLVVDATIERRPTGDAFDFFLAGKTVVQIIDANLWFHSSGDRIDTMHPNGLERATRLYAYVLDQIDQASWDELGRKSR
jgi:hypothetical protein